MEPAKSAGGVVVNPHGDVLLVQNKGKTWSLPKGHIAPGEDKLQAARREIYEESGLTELEMIRPLGSYRRQSMLAQVLTGKTEFKEITLFLFKTKQMDLKPVDEDNPDARWVPKDEVVQLLTSKADKEFFSKVLHEIG